MSALRIFIGLRAVRAVLVLTFIASAQASSPSASVVLPEAVREDGSAAPVWVDDWTPAYSIAHFAPLPGPSDGADRGGAPLLLDFIPVGVPPEGDTPTELAFTPDGSSFVIAHRDSQNLVVFDAATRTVIDTIPVSGSPNSLAIASDGVHVVTANLYENTASIVDLTTATEVAVVPVGTQPGVVRITPDGLTAVVGNTVDGTLSVIDIATATELRQVPGANFGQTTSFISWAVLFSFTDYAIAQDNKTVIFPDMFNAQIQFFDITTGGVNSVVSDPNAAVVSIGADGTMAVVSHTYPDSKVTVLDVVTQTITKVIPTGASATMVPPIALNPTNTKAIVAVQNAVRVINLVTDGVSGDLATGTPAALATTADGLYAIVGNYLGTLVGYASESIVANYLSTTTPDALAASPVNPRAATAHALRKEVSEVMNTSGPAGFLEGIVPTGPTPEGDKARNVAITADGTRAVVVNNHSQNATVIDLTTGAIEAVVPTGERPGDVAITPDGSKAVVANLDSTFASVIDLTTFGATSISISRRGSQVAISPDGQYAYIPVVASGDGVWRINLGTMSVDGPKRTTGNMGGIGFVFDLASGIALSHDGATLAVCGSFDNNVSIIDTASWAEVARVPVETFPVRAAFSPDNSLVYVSNKNANSVSVVTNAGGGSGVLRTLSVGSQPFELTTNPSGTRLYVANFDSRSISVFETTGFTLVDAILLPQTGGAGQPVGLHVSASGAELYVAANGADFHLIDTASHTITDTVNMGLAPTELVFSDVNRCGYCPTPLGDDGLTIVCIAGSAPAAPLSENSLGIACADNDGCEPTAVCLDGFCHVAKNRYVSVDPNPVNSGQRTARRVSLDLGGGQSTVIGWFGAPAEVAVAGGEPSPQLLVRLVDEVGRHYRDWSVDDASLPWVDATAHLGDCEVSPGQTYLIQAIAEGADPSDEAQYSTALVLSTVVDFGDVVGTSPGLPPDTNRNFKDISAVVRGFQSIQTEPKVWLDLQGGTATPEIPDFSDISFTDINHAVAGFQGGSYPFATPCDCPGQSCP